MSDDDVDIRSGTLVAVDTEDLRTAAARLAVLGGRFDGIRELLAGTTRTLNDAGIWRFAPTLLATEARDRARKLSRKLHDLADMYEIVENRAAMSIAEAAGDEVGIGRLRARAWWVALRNPLAYAWVARDQGVSTLQRYRDLGVQYGGFLPMWGPFAASATTLLLAAVDAIGRGAVPGDTRLAGPHGAGVARELSRGRTTAPTSLAQLTDRVPGDDGRVRVERYTLPDGSRRFVAYVTGTREMFDTGEAWNMISNLQLYLSHAHASSYDIAHQALRMAGAGPHDPITLVGHSQGALITSHLALSGDFDVTTHVTFGSPVQAQLGDDTLDVALRHRDDVVAALAGGGMAAGAGAAGSFVAERTTRGTLASGEGAIDPHSLDEYRETAELLDASEDPRMDAVRRRLAEYDGAVRSEVFVYRAEVPQPGVSASAEDEG